MSLHSFLSLPITCNPDAVSVTGLDLSIESKSLFKNTNFKITRGDRICFLGRNGSGKSTLFRWISEQDLLAWSVYEVAQELPASDQSVLQIVLAAHLERGRLWDRQQELEFKQDLTDSELAEFTDLGNQLNAMKADADPPRAKKILRGLGFSQENMVQPLKNFSGGWRARVALAQGLFMEPDLLMLDEPTNHLDLNAVIWLQEMCAKWSKTLIIISHNTGFIQRAANSIWEIRNNQIYSYNCSYRKYLKQRDHDVKKKIKDWELLEKELAALKKKGTPASKKAAEDLLSKRTREGVSRPEKAYVPKFILMNKSTASTDAALLKTDNATLGYSSEKIILRNVTFALYPGSRIALVGENGSGKSTFLKFLTDELEYVAGCSVEKKKGLRVCKFDQHFYHSLPEQQTPIQYLSAFSEIDIVRKILGASGLEGSAHSRPIQTLSGGQKARVYFASLSIQSPDILLLDEPTNHLDIETISGLSQALLEFSGAAVIVSHDVEFLSELATEVWCVKHSQLVRLSEGSEGLEQYVEDIISSIDMN